MDPILVEAKGLYVESLEAMTAELTGLLQFAKDFRPDTATSRLTMARMCLTEELEETRGKRN